MSLKKTASKLTLSCATLAIAASLTLSVIAIIAAVLTYKGIIP